MKLEVGPMCIETEYPFQIARGTRQKYDIFIFAVTHEGVTGWGEASPQPFYGEDPLTVRAAVGSLGGLPDGDPDEVRMSLHDRSTSPGAALAEHPSVRAALDMALWDLRGKMEGTPCYQFFGADPSNAPLSSFTIGFDKPDIVDRKVDGAVDFRILKVKVGLPGDMEILDRILERSGKKVRVDANQGWDVEMAIEKTKELYEKGVEFCEQPIDHADEDGLRTLKRLSPLPIMLDESIVRPGDAARKADQGHGINIKLMKCGGLTPALELIEEARAHNLSVMLGCMIETSLAVTAAAHLSPLVDYADLDAGLLLREDPFEGVKFAQGRVVLPEGPGLGVTRRGE